MTLRQNLRIDEGTTYSFVHTHRDSTGAAIDLTGYTARMSIKRKYNAAIQAFLSTGSDANGGTLTLGGAAGTITIDMTATETDALVDDVELESLLSGEKAEQIEVFIYDLEIISGATVTRVIQGKLFLHRAVTT